MSVPFQGDAVEGTIPRVVAHLRAGGLIAYPTETVYGLGGLARPEVVARVAALKGRPPGKPFLLIISGPAMAEGLGLLFTDAARAMARVCWPGPLTLVLAGGPRLPEQLRGPEGGIAVRHTSHRALARLVTALGEPLTSTSANRPGERPAPGAETIEAQFAAAVAAGELLVLDGGVIGQMPPSTLVDCTTSQPRLIREGAIPRAELRRMVGRLAP